jgi:hypothetical protein
MATRPKVEPLLVVQKELPVGRRKCRTLRRREVLEINTRVDRGRTRGYVLVPVTFASGTAVES